MKIRKTYFIEKNLDYKLGVACAKLSKIEKVTKSDVINFMIAEFLRNGKKFRENLEKVAEEKHGQKN